VAQSEPATDLGGERAALAAGDKANAERQLVKILERSPKNVSALALSLFNRGALAEAEHHARNAVRIAPMDAQSDDLMGMIMTGAHRPQVGEHHYRWAMKLIASPSPVLVATWPGT
jgi:Flp pilus assembly protein TadD